MAMRDSVTVSMSEEITGMFSDKPSASAVPSCGVLRQDLRIQGGQRYVVVRQADIAVAREKGLRRFIKLPVEVVEILLAMSENAPAARRLASRNGAQQGCRCASVAGSHVDGEMGNHYHLVVETPQANLAAGMAWLQSAYTTRLNHRHKLAGRGNLPGIARRKSPDQACSGSLVRAY